MENITHLLERCRAQKHLFLASDRDGTLVPYADRPENAVMSPATRQVLIDLAKLPNTVITILSARSIALLKRDLDDPQIILAGNYGMEIRLAGGKQLNAPGAETALPELKRVLDKLAGISNDFSGSILEDHGYSLCLHWHAVAGDQRARLQDRLAELSSKLVTVAMHRLPTSNEFLPKIIWDKSSALELIASQLPITQQKPFFMYIGDSAPDEPAFQWANDHGGISIKVGNIDQPTVAKGRLAQPLDLTLFLQQLLSERAVFTATAYNTEDDPKVREKKIEAVFNTLKADYALKLPDKISELEERVCKAINDGNSLVSLEEARNELHRLKGTIGSYGFSELALLIGEIETILQSIERSDKDSLSQLWQKMEPTITDTFERAKLAARFASGS